MSRAPMQVLVLPYVLDSDGTVRYGVLLRADSNQWQGVGGGAEDDESAREAAQRETFEELGTDGFQLTQLDSMSSVPAHFFAAWPTWREANPELYVVPEYAFGALVRDTAAVHLSGEHQTIEWMPIEEARRKLRWDSNRNALWELDQRLHHNELR
jgi:dATP pyrophosphohydrolase